MDVSAMKQQLREAIIAGECALTLLTDAEESLSSAQGWGLFDMLGGGFISTLAKRSKMNDAKDDLEAAQRALRDFERELRDVQIAADLKFKTGGFLSFADYVFDSTLVDFLVQRKIDKAKSSLKKTKRQVASILKALKEKYSEL